MASDQFIVLLGVLLIVAFGAEQALARLRVPPVLVLIGCGAALAKGTNWLPSERLLEVAPHFGALAFLLILFEGGLDLDLDDVLRRFNSGVILAIVTFGFAVVSSAAVLWPGLDWQAALVLGIVVAPISGAIVIPLVAHLPLSPGVRTALVLEAALADVLGVLGLSVAATLILGGGLAGFVALGSALAALFAALLGIATGVLWPAILRGLGERSYLDVLSFGIALSLWGVCELLGAPGALAVLAFGFGIANEDAVRGAIGLRQAPTETEIRQAALGLHRFIGQLTFLVRAFFFVFIGAVVRLAGQPLARYVQALVLVLLFVVGRWCAFRLLGRRSEDRLEKQEVQLALFLQPRGLVTAVLAIEAIHLDLPGAEAALDLASLVIIASNLLLAYGLMRSSDWSPRPSEA